MNSVFLDSVGLIALWNKSDQWHVAAVRAYADIRQARSNLVTTRYVLLECGNAAARSTIRRDVIELRKLLTQSNALISPSDDDWDRAWANYDRHIGGDAGIVDHVFFVVMRRLGLRQAFTNDQHFAAAGFDTLF